MTRTDQAPEQPNLEHIVGEENPAFSIFLRGHLVIEALLTQQIQLKQPMSDHHLSDMSFAAKKDRCFWTGAISIELRIFLTEVNRLRNRFGHRLG